MNKVNFDNLKNIEAPEKWIENAINIPNTEQKKSPILALFSTKSSRLIAAAACLILVSAIALTIFLTQDRVTPPIDPNFSVTEPAVETQDVTQAQSDSSEQTHSSGDNKSDTTSSSEYEKTEPTESSTTTTQSGGITSSTQHNSTNAVVKPTAKPVEKETTAKATEPTEKLDDDKDDDEQSYPDSTPSGSTGKPSVKPIVKPTVKPTQAPVTEPTEEPVVNPTVEPTEEPVVKPTSKPNTPPAMLMLPTIPSPDFLPPENFDGPPSVTPTEPTTPPEVSPTEPTEPSIESPTEPPFVDPSEPFEPPVTETEPVSPTEPTTNPNDLPHYVIDVTNTIYCHIDDPVCVGYLDPPVHIGDDYYCSLYDKNLNVIGYYEHYYYSEYLKASIKPIYQENKIRCEYSLKYREMVTSVGTYYYCFYNDEGKILYWGKMVVYE